MASIPTICFDELTLDEARDCPFQRVMTRLARSTISRFMRRMADMGPTCSGAILTTCLRVLPSQNVKPVLNDEPRAHTLEDAALLQLPRELGVDPADGKSSLPQTGDTAPMSSRQRLRSIDSEEQLLTITLSEAIKIYELPKVFRQLVRNMAAAAAARVRRPDVGSQSGRQRWSLRFM